MNLNWTQEQLAIRLQIAGWDVDRGHVSKIEARLVRVTDFHQLFLAEVLKVSVMEIFPRQALETAARLNLPEAVRSSR